MIAESFCLQIKIFTHFGRIYPSMIDPFSIGGEQHFVLQLRQQLLGNNFKVKDGNVQQDKPLKAVPSFPGASVGSKASLKVRDDGLNPGSRGDSVFKTAKWSALLAACPVPTVRE